jgi:hypothetical protein
MSDLERFQQHFHVEDPYREWVLLGDDGAVTFLVFPQDKTKANDTACTIGIHARKKLATMPRRGKCDVLPEGYCYEQTKIQGAHELWVLSGHGREEKVIWEVLSSWYNTTFGTRGSAETITVTSNTVTETKRDTTRENENDSEIRGDRP